MIILLTYFYLFINITPSHTSSENLFYESTLDEDSPSSESNRVENYIKILSAVLTQPWTNGESPLVYVENQIDQFLSNKKAEVFSDSSDMLEFKRSKYYRKYPLKRQNKYMRYDAENRYMCLPSREEVFKLLVALHQTKQGKRGQRINFCNRKRLTGTLYSNVRFLGK